ncbi:MAG: hypothetical protein JSS66_10185 [Armatimonadetes bacterium]|nr:hypothetical protein [Armatimonadota bacterium]
MSLEIPEWGGRYPALLTALARVETEYPELLEFVQWRAVDSGEYGELEVGMAAPFNGTVNRIGIVFDALPDTAEIECTPWWYGVCHSHINSGRGLTAQDAVSQCFALLRKWLDPQMILLQERRHGPKRLFGLTQLEVQGTNPPGWPKVYEEGESIEYSNASGTIHGRIEGPRTLEYTELVRLIMDKASEP